MKSTDVIKTKGYFTKDDGDGGLYFFHPDQNSSRSIDDATPAEWNQAAEEANYNFKINDKHASNWASFQTGNPNFQAYFSTDNKWDCDKALKERLSIDSKTQIDTSIDVNKRFKAILSDYGDWCAQHGIGNMPPVSIAQAVQYGGGSLDEEDDGLAISQA